MVDEPSACLAALSTPFEPALFTRLRSASRVIVSGAGGGFDVYSGLPIALALRNMGKEVFLANLTFTYLGGTDAKQMAPHLAEVQAHTQGELDYFPERTLARWLASKGLPDTVYAFDKTGVVQLTESWATLKDHLSADAVVLVDGGTDILMRGDEAGLGTPEEDAMSLAAVAALDVPTRLLACIGFGIDAFHGVCHAHFLENVAALERDGHYLGAFSVPRASEEGAAFLDAVQHAAASTPKRPSIVNGSIAAAVRGEFGDVHFTKRTSSSELFINPLMGLYFTFDLEGVAARSLLVRIIRETETVFEVSALIEAVRERVSIRPRKPIPG